MKIENIFSENGILDSHEIFEILLKADNFKLERIISSGQSTPEGEWLCQEWDEGVILLSGKAGLSFEDEECILDLFPGDYIHIPANMRHRVEWTDQSQKTVWLALHYKE
ncbi:MAG: cupin domain-containing protein [Armatimonadetes bacterium]|nr:cupin domain-containing protein [Armatimonadota bacterium]